MFQIYSVIGRRPRRHAVRPLGNPFRRLTTLIFSVVATPKIDCRRSEHGAVVARWGERPRPAARPAPPACRSATGGLVVFITGTPIASKYAISQITFSNYSRFGDRRGRRPAGPVPVELSRRTFRRASADCKWSAHTDLALIALARMTQDDSFDRRRARAARVAFRR